MSNPNHPHCKLGQPLTPEEQERLRELLRQQGITLEATNLIAPIEEESPRESCPFRRHLGSHASYCTSECHIREMLEQKG